MAESDISHPFEAFFETWLSHQQHFLHQLTALSTYPNVSDRNCLELAARVLAHYHKYYEEKTKAANQDIFLVLSPPWLSSFERAMLWISGFRPSILFPIVTGSVGDDLSDEQMRQIETARVETRRMERVMAEDMARIQESMAAPPMLGLIRRAGRLVDGEVGELETVMEELKAAMVVVVANADALCGVTAGKVVEILNPVQTIKFLAAAANFQLQARRWGLMRDSQLGTPPQTRWAP